MGIISDKINAEVAEALLEVHKSTAQVAAGLAQWQNGNRLTGARPLQINGHGRLWGGSGRLVGWSIVSIGGPVTILIRDSRAAGNGDVLAVLDVVDTESETQWFGPGGISFGEGVFLDVQSGSLATLKGSVWLGAVD
jgi:hypothetical protein